MGQSINTKIDFLNDMTRTIDAWILHATLLLHKYDALYTGMLAMATGHLSPTLIDEHTMRRALEHVQQELDTTRIPMTMIETNPLFYYQHGTYVATAHNDSVYITLQIPLTSWKGVFRVFDIGIHPIPIPDSRLVTVIQGLPPAVAIEVGGKHFYHMSEQELEALHRNQHSTIRKIFYKTRDTTCLMNVFKGDLMEVNKTCKFGVTAALEGDYIQLWNETAFLFTNTTDVMVHCLDPGQVLTPCVGCIVPVSDGCYLDAPTLTTSIINGTSLHTELGYIINLPVAAKFFDSNELETLRRHALLNEKATLKVPEFNNSSTQ